MERPIYTSKHFKEQNIYFANLKYPSLEHFFPYFKYRLDERLETKMGELAMSKRRRILGQFILPNRPLAEDELLLSSLFIHQVSQIPLHRRLNRKVDRDKRIAAFIVQLTVTSNHVTMTCKNLKKEI